MNYKRSLICMLATLVLVGCGTSTQTNESLMNENKESSSEIADSETLNNESVDTDVSGSSTSELDQSEGSVQLGLFFSSLSAKSKRDSIEVLAEEKNLYSHYKNTGTGKCTYKVSDNIQVTNTNKTEKGNFVTITFNMLNNDEVIEITYFDINKMIEGKWNSENGYMMKDYNDPKSEWISTKTANEIINYVPSLKYDKDYLGGLFSSIYEGMTEEDFISEASEFGLVYNPRGVGNEKTISYDFRIGDKFGDDGSKITFSVDDNGVLAKVVYDYYPLSYRSGSKAEFYSENYANQNDLNAGFNLSQVNEKPISYDSAQDLLDVIYGPDVSFFE